MDSIIKFLRVDAQRISRHAKLGNDDSNESLIKSSIPLV